MLVKDRMSSDPVTVATDTSLKEALDIVRSNPFRHLPVLDENGELVGMVTEKSLVYAAQKLSKTDGDFESDEVLAQTPLGQIIHGSVLTVGPNLPIEEAARRMVDHRIGCLPVVEGGRLIGIISDTDIFRVFVEGLGGGHPSLRLTLVVPEAVGSLLKIVRCVADLGGNIHSLGTYWGQRPEDRVVAFRLEGVDRETAVQALESEGIQVVNVWEP